MAFLKRIDVQIVVTSQLTIWLILIGHFPEIRALMANVGTICIEFYKYHCYMTAHFAEILFVDAKLMLKKIPTHRKFCVDICLRF